MKQTIQIQDTGSYKTGLNEIVGLKAAMMELMKPITKQLNEMDSWSGEGWFKVEETEYLGRDGFIPHSHNCGGLEINSIIPKCGESDFSFLEFGEYSDREDGMTDDEYDREREIEEGEGHLDAKLRIWLKFEGYDQETGELSFYLYCGGGNGDAPYFRTKYENDVFEASFTCKSIAGLKRAGMKHVKALLNQIK